MFNHAIVFLFLKVHSIAVPSNPAFPFVRIPSRTSLGVVLETSAGIMVDARYEHDEWLFLFLVATCGLIYVVRSLLRSTLIKSVEVPALAFGKYEHQ